MPTQVTEMEPHPCQTRAEAPAQPPQTGTRHCRIGWVGRRDEQRKPLGIGVRQRISILIGAVDRRDRPPQTVRELTGKGCLQPVVFRNAHKREEAGGVDEGQALRPRHIRGNFEKRLYR